MVLQTLLKSIKERNFRGIAKQTEQLDPQTRQHLQEYLHTNLESEENAKEELEELEDELDMATLRLKDLQEKEEFIGTRLRAYQAKLKAIQNNPGNKSDQDQEDDDAAVPPTMSLEKQQEHATSLQKIQQVHNDMKHNIQVLTKKIKEMEKRKLELSWHLEECQVVLKTTKEMEQAETELAFEEVTDGIVTDDDSHNDASIPVHTSSNSKQQQAAASGGDEEAGMIEMTTYDLNAKDDAVISSKENGEKEVGNERIQKEEEGIEDALASRLAIADEQV